MMPQPPPEVAVVFAAAPPQARKGLLALRALIFRVAASLPEPAPVTEALRWGQPAYLVPKGSTIRIGLPKSGGFALYCHCRTSLVADFRDLVGPNARTEGNRAVLFQDPKDVDTAPVAQLIARASTWHRRSWSP
jgi:hypothetical protein